MDVSPSDPAAVVDLTEAELRPPIDLLRDVSTTLGLRESMALRVGWEASPGQRGADRMEDRTIAVSVEGVALAAVFDGHNGDAAADYCSKQLIRLLHSKIVHAGEADPVKALTSTFPMLHERFTHSLGADESGCTALAALCLPGAVHVANAGDCRCVLWSTDPSTGEHSIKRLNEEHTCLLPSERSRVEGTGATVSTTSDGKLRVGGIIQVTRCIGDNPLRHLGLTSEPTLMSVEVTEGDKALVMASDGLWDVMPESRVLHCLLNTAKSPDMIAKRLLMEALDRGTDDNTSVVVVFLKDLSAEVYGER